MRAIAHRKCTAVGSGRAFRDLHRLRVAGVMGRVRFSGLRMRIICIMGHDGHCSWSAVPMREGGGAPSNAAHAEQAISNPPPPPSTRCPCTPQGRGLRPARREVPTTGVATGP